MDTMNNIKKVTTRALATFVVVMFAQNLHAAETSSSGIANMPLYLLGGTALVVIFTAVIAAYRLLDLMIRTKEISIYEQHGLDKYLAEKKANEGSWWKRFSRQMTAAVPVEKEHDILLDHNYDGIQELDNSLPPWWLYGFYLTILISIVYMGVYHFSSYAKSSEELYEIEMAEAQEAVDEFVSKQANKVDENNVITLVDEQSLAAGKEVFETSCVACHLSHGGSMPGGVGPNLTDQYWLHGGGIKDIFSTIKYGVPEKGMISWKEQIRPADIQNVSSYILSLQGTDPPNAKEPQGEIYIAAETVETDSTVLKAEIN